MYASRNLRLCTKDCVCLFVCPTGATDTENGQIDRDRCIEGCRLCVDACPSHAIHLVMENYAQPARKNDDLSAMMMAFCERKMDQSSLAAGLAAGDAESGLARLARALEKSCRILAEDCAREAGYMIPEAARARELLTEIAPELRGEKKEAVDKLLWSS